MIKFIKKASYSVFFLVFIFLSKLWGVIDIGILIGAMLCPIYFLRNKHLSKKMVVVIITFLSLASYSFFISILYGGEELIWGLKFIKSALLFISTFFVMYFFQKNTDGFKLETILIYAIFLHAIIVIMLIFFPEIRGYIYPITGYLPRGPEWSRSPGLTISFNSTAIVHIVGLYLILFNTTFSKIKKGFLSFIIGGSLFFLGRFSAYTGLIMLAMTILVRSKRKITFLVSIAVTCFLLLSVYNLPTKELDTVVGQVQFNIKRALEPIFSREKGVESYYSRGFNKHVFFSDSIITLLFGESFSGHIGIKGGKGVTNSDIGLINCINGIGLFATLMTYILQVYFGISTTHNRYILMTMVCLMSLLSLKETGLFESNSTNILFLLWVDAVLKDAKEKNMALKNELTSSKQLVTSVN